MSAKNDALDAIGASCPNNGTFYVCDDKPKKFVGCCTQDPCKTDDGMCPDDRLYAAAFDKYSYSLLAPQQCDSDDPDVLWYTCAETKDFAFMGCCASRACENGGCPDKDLRPAVLSDVPKDAAVFTGEDVDDGGSGGLSKGAIGGIAAGAAVVIIAIIALALFCFFKRRRNNKANKVNAGSSYEPFAGQQLPNQPSSPHTVMQDNKFSTYSPYSTSPSYTSPSVASPYNSHASVPQGQAPPYWQAAGGQLSPPIPGTASTPGHTPSPSQPTFRDSVHNAHAYAHGHQHPSHDMGGHHQQQQSWTAELPASERMSAVPNVSEVSYNGATGRESEISAASWRKSDQPLAPAELPGPERGADERR